MAFTAETSPFRAVAIDYDGTLTSTRRPDPAVLEAVATVRRSGRTVILCTGRILAELHADFPDVEQHFDAIVAENGAVVWLPDREIRDLAEPIPVALEAALRERGVPVRRGRVLLACDAVHDMVVFEEVRRLGLEDHLMHNRGALMILPPDVSKASGLLHVLGDLGISHHSTVGVGDAENDHAFLDACELGIATGNAVPSLQQRADVVLPHDDGAGVREFLCGSILRGDFFVESRRWRVVLGRCEDGTDVTIPGSGANVLITGGPGSGKSYAGGLLVERLVRLGYSVCVFDPEGDHTGLEAARGVLKIGGPDGLPELDQVERIFRHRFSSVVIDLSLRSRDEKTWYVREALERFDHLRTETGLPHWIVLDEADQLLAGRRLCGRDAHARPLGFALVTYRPRGLSPDVLDAVDRVIALRGAEPFARIPVEPDPPTVGMFTLDRGGALLAGPDGVVRFQLAAREFPHVRHHRKYVEGQLPWARRFFLRRNGAEEGRSAGNIGEFYQEFRTARPVVVAHHIRNGDVSRWVRDVLGDVELSDDLRTIERWFQGEAGADADVARSAVLAAIRRRYGVGEADESGPEIAGEAPGSGPVPDG